MAKKALNKSSFIRTFGVDVPASTIVDAAKKKGFKLDPKFVYVVRSLDKKRAAGKSSRKAVTTPDVRAAVSNLQALGNKLTRAATPAAPLSMPQLEHNFRGIVVRIGLDNAKTLLASYEASL